MRTLMLSICFAAFLAAPAFAVKSGDAAPDFSLSASDGKQYSLSAYKGKIVVLEWLNYGCPFVQKHYNAKFKNMQGLQKKYTAKPGVVWFSVISSAEGKQGFSSAEQAEKDQPRQIGLQRSTAKRKTLFQIANTKRALL